MKTAFTAAQLADPEIAAADGILRTCVHYGFCTAVCPTYVLTRDENEAPRGRIDLIRAMLERGGRPDPKTVGHIDSCLSCNSCMTTCAVDVDYLHLADIARAHIEENYRRPLGDRFIRWLIARTVTDPARFARMTRLARLARPFRALLPGRLGTLVELAPAALPPRQDLAGVHPAEGGRRRRVVLLQGCVQRAQAPEINAATVRLLTRHGIEVVVPADAGCCGALTLHMGKAARAEAAASRNVDAWHAELARGGLDAVVVNASGCGTVVKDYARLLARDPARRGKAAAVAAIARDVTELLAPEELRLADSAVPLTIAYHDACSLQHAQKIRTRPRALLRVAGFDLRDVPEGHFCCGSAGAYSMLQPGMAEALGRRKAGHVESTGALALAAGNLGCLVQLARFTGLPALHTVELLDWATGGKLPPALHGVALPEPVARAETAVASAEPAAPPVQGGPAGPAIW
ncbi:MAG: glycolate oxidase subunit GlcF [Defluviicoccus sp.]|nr:glycolate oxidase subunit GlcF [Defluviicoccus sp.]MDE0385169.1 glycolate oxidase subunit GlcF [Defluviicoccus sp.]